MVNAIAGDRYAWHVEVVESCTGVSAPGNSPRLESSGVAFALRSSFTHGERSENRVEHIVQAFADVLDQKA